MVFIYPSRAEISTPKKERMVMVQEFPNYNLVYLYPYKTLFFLTYPLHKEGHFAFQYKKDGEIVSLNNQELVLFLASNNLPTPKPHYTLAQDNLIFVVPIFLFLMVISVVFIVIKKRTKFKPKQPGYLRRK
jgi:hypothetical protein